MIETPASGGQPPARTLKTQYSSPLLSLGSVCPQVLMAKSTPQFKPWMVAQPRGPLFRPTCTRTVNRYFHSKRLQFSRSSNLIIAIFNNSHCKSIGNNCNLGTVKTWGPGRTCGPTRHRDQRDTKTDRTWRRTGLRDRLKLETDWTQRSTGLGDQPNLRTNKNWRRTGCGD